MMTNSEEQRLLDLLRDHPRKSREIVEELGWDQKTVRGKLRELIGSGALKRTGHLYGFADAEFEPLTTRPVSIRERLTTGVQKTRNYDPSSPLSIQRKVAVLKVLSDGKWRNRREVAIESGVPDRQLENIIPDLTKSGVLTKVGEEFRDPASSRNRASTRNEFLLSVLSKPILERNLHDRFLLSDTAITRRLYLLQDQELAVFSEVFLRTRASIKTLRFWCSSSRSKQLDDLIAKLDPDRDGFVDPQKLPRPRRRARTSSPSRSSQPRP